MTEIVVHQLPGAWGLLSISPFCLKLEAYLRIAEIPYRTVVDATPFRAPKGKLPWIEHDGVQVADSGFIVEYLASRFAFAAEERLTPVERAVALAMRRLLEENLYWTLVYDRWMVGSNWQTFRDVVLGGVPAALRPVIAPIARRGVRRQLLGHGIGVHTPDEIHAIGRRDIGALADVLGDKPYFMGEAPTEIDAIAYGFLANIVKVPIVSPVQDEARRHQNLVDFIDRVHQRYFP